MERNFSDPTPIVHSKLKCEFAQLATGHLARFHFQSNQLHMFNNFAWLNKIYLVITKTLPQVNSKCNKPTPLFTSFTFSTSSEITHFTCRCVIANIDILQTFKLVQFFKDFQAYYLLVFCWNHSIYHQSDQKPFNLYTVSFSNREDKYMDTLPCCYSRSLTIKRCDNFDLIQDI